jgi:RNA polymerase sigma-70 factor (ECF subfamily)
MGSGTSDLNMFTRSRSHITSAHQERATIANAQRGEAAAFEQLYLEHHRRVFNLCYRMVNDWSRAEELTQDTFLQVYRKLESFRFESAFSTWIHRIAVNMVLMHLRQNRALTHEVAFETSIADDGESTFTYESIGRSDERLEHILDRVALEDAISRLPEGYRVIFLLHDVEGYEHHEIAELLGCSIGNTKSQLHKARLKIRRYLQGNLSRRERNLASVA